MYSEHYGKSKALIIGINKYLHASPLSYAVSDATAIADLLVDRLGFAEENVTILTDAAADRASIMRAFLGFTRDGTDPDDRLMFFFAGHGHTITSLKGEVGYLIPVDGDSSDLSTLLRWDDLTRNADLIPAKHILFIMDACYGGLAITRAFNPGAMRFMRDMLQRLSRQVLTAGKADEPVADAGGPLPNHSIFTGHLIEALDGKARDNAGNLTANGVISYVYRAVSNDVASNQTPHYGYLHGDGDFIFDPLPTNDEKDGKVPETERLISVPAIFEQDEILVDHQTRLKELLVESKYRIQLHDFVAMKTRELLSKTGEDFYSVQGPVTNEAFVERLHQYENALSDLIPQQMLLGRWGQPEHAESLTLPLKRMAERIESKGGVTHLLESRWYPIYLLMYSSLIGAVIGDNFIGIRSLLHSKVPDPYSRKNGSILISQVCRAMTEIHDAFKLIPGHERNFVPRSEYLFKYFQPPTDDTLFVGGEYENLFDRVELYIALEYAHFDHPEPISDEEMIWGPIGRFGWKAGRGDGPLQQLITEANTAGEDWMPLKAGLFGASLKRFIELAHGLSRRIAWLQWF